MYRLVAYVISLLLLIQTSQIYGESKTSLRIVSLSPSLTDMLIELDSTDLLVGILDAGTRSTSLANIESVGNYGRFSLEKLISLKPDLILIWPTSIPKAEKQQLTQLGFKLLEVAPQNLDELATQFEYLGQQIGRPQQGKRLAEQVQNELKQLKQKYQRTKPIKVFYQVWDKPLYTIGKNQIITDALTICGAVNIFSNIDIPAPEVNIESVIAQEPQVIIIPDKHQLAIWHSMRQLSTLKNTQFIIFDNEQIARPSFAMLQATKELCQKINPTLK